MSKVMTRSIKIFLVINLPFKALQRLNGASSLMAREQAQEGGLARGDFFFYIDVEWVKEKKKEFFPPHWASFQGFEEKSEVMGQ